MLRRIGDRLTYANVTASLALFVALGGTSYAAIKLPRNSVGSAQIRSRAVGGSEIRNGAIRSADIYPGTRRALRGAQGAPGAQGLPGPAAGKYFAAVSANGSFVRGNATSGGHPAVGSGSYSVGFAQNVSACAFSATVGTTDASNPGPGRVTVRDDGGRVGVQTYDAAGTPADLPFHLVVAC
jgi:hypothetical protein